MSYKPGLKIRRALLSVSDKTGIVELGRALADSGAELIATGKTATVLREAGLKITPIEEVSGVPEAFRGRMKTISFPVFSGILYRRGDEADEADCRKLGIGPIDCVVVNFYPFEKAAEKPGISTRELIEEIDIGGPSLVRAAAKNSPDVLVLSDPVLYGDVISELRSNGVVSKELAERCVARTWLRVEQYDRAIAERFGTTVLPLRYGENPHQSAFLKCEKDSPIVWDEPLTSTAISYNNVLDLSAAYQLACDLIKSGDNTGVVIIKHNNPCGVAVVPRTIDGGIATAQKQALSLAWAGDPVSAFGSVIVFTDPLEVETATWLADKFVELVAAPGLGKDDRALGVMLAKRKNLKALSIRRFEDSPKEMRVCVPGGVLVQNSDMGGSTGFGETLKPVTSAPWSDAATALAHFGIVIARALKSNALSIVRAVPGVPGAMQLVGAGQGQPNRIDALKSLAIPRAREVLTASGGSLSDCVLVSDAFFPFRDVVDSAHEAGIKHIVQPGGSIRDSESIKACDEHGIAMVFTGVRHFRH